MGPIGCSETSVRDYGYTLRNKPDERRFHLFGGGSLKSRQIMFLYILMFVFWISKGRQTILD